MTEYRHFNTTIMFIDMKGWTSRTSSSSRAELKKTLDEFENIVFPVVKKFQGKIIKGLGDAFLISFESPTDSVLCGIQIQKAIKARNNEVSKKEGFTARVGIDAGEVYERGGDIFGEPVNLAARIQSVAKGGQVAFGESVYHAMNKNEISHTSIGKHKLKGINHKVNIYQAHEKRKLGLFARINSFFRRNKRKFIIALIIFFFLIIVSNNNNSVQDMNQFNWEGESIAALENNDIETIESLIKSYEKTSENDINFEERLIAVRLYNKVGDTKSLEILQNLARKFKEDEDRIMRIYETGKEIGFDLPEVREILENNKEQEYIEPEPEFKEEYIEPEPEFKEEYIEPEFIEPEHMQEPEPEFIEPEPEIIN